MRAGGRGGGSEDPLRVAMLVARYPPAFSGAGIQAANLARALSALGVEVEVLAHRPPGSDAPSLERERGFEVRRFGSPRFDRERKFLFGLRVGARLLTHPNWDLLHVHGFAYWAVGAVSAARLLRRPILVKTTLSRADGPDQPSRLVASAYRSVDAIVALSDDLEREFRSAPGFGAQILRIPNGVDAERFRPARGGEREAARAHFGIPDDALVISTVGQLDRRKNVVQLVRAAGRIPGHTVCLALAGPDPSEADYARELEGTIAELPPGVSVLRPGRLPPDRIAELLRGSDVFVLVSRSEGLPNSLLEGMASGLACLATDIPGSRDVLADGGGRLVPLDDVDALARELSRLADDPSERMRLGREAEAIVQSRYSIASVARSYVSAYRELLGT